MASAANAGGAGGGASLLHSVGDGVEDGHLDAVMLEDLAAFAGRDAGDDGGAVFDGEFGVAGTEFAGDALHEDFGVGFD